MKKCVQFAAIRNMAAVLTSDEEQVMSYFNLFCDISHQYNAHL